MQKHIADKDAENADLSKRILALEEQLKNGSKTPSVAAPPTPEVQAQPVVSSRLEKMLESAMARMETMEDMFKKQQPATPTPSVSSKPKGTGIDSGKSVPASTPMDDVADEDSSDESEEDDEYVTTPDGQTAP